MDKYQHMRAFITAATEYSKHPNETTVSVLQRNLGTIGASLDYSIFDPGSSVAAEFFMNLHELMNSLASRSTLTWSAVTVLQHACRNAAARQALIHIYKFTPILSRLLEANLTSEKRMRVLQLLQELTYGVKISWQEVHLPYLISTLAQWVNQSTEEDVVGLSLGVLVNLCYKNLPAIYTLMRTVDAKAFMRRLVTVQNNNINTRVQCCKLLIILEHINSEIPDEVILDFASITFMSLIAALRDKDVLLLRHIVDFFTDVRDNEHSRSVLITYPNYAKDVHNILTTLETNPDPDCVALMMQFLQSLVRLQLHMLVPLYANCVRVAMTWIPVEQVCSKALGLVRTIVVEARRTRCSLEVLNELDLSILMLVLDTGSETENQNISCSIESQARSMELLQLLQEIVRIPTLRSKVMENFTDQLMRRLLEPMLAENPAATREGGVNGNLFQNPATTLYVHALSLTADLATHDSGWLTLYAELLRKKEIQMVMAVALYTGDLETKQKILQLASTRGFPQDCVSSVAKCMGELEPLILVQSGAFSGSTSRDQSIRLNYHPNEMAPLFSLAQEGRLDVFIARLQEVFEANRIQDITASSVMELYEYKLAAMRHAERAMQGSLEAANSHVTSLQHRLAQIMAESSRLHQLLFYTQQCLEGSQAEKLALLTKFEASEAKNNKALINQKQENHGLKKIVQEKTTVIDQLSQTLAELTSKYEDNEARMKEQTMKNNELVRLLRKLEDGLTKKEQILEEKNKEIASNLNDMSAMKAEIEDQANQFRICQLELVAKAQTIERLNSELTEFSRMRDMIFELTVKKKDDLNAS